MGFIDSYKHLEKICGEILDNDRCISAYIDEMINTPGGSFYVKHWNEDLKKLKHYRWVRNQIVHEPNCNESNMCKPEDELWLEDFYSRIMNQTDPLVLYYKATASHKGTTPSQPHIQQVPMYNHSRKSSQTAERYIIFVATLAIIAVILLLGHHI